MSKPWIRSFSSPGPTGLRELGDIAQNRGGAANCTLEIILKNSTDGLHLEAVESWHHFGFRVVLHLDGCYMMGNMLKHILGMGKWYEMMVYRWEMWSFCGLTGWLSSEQISTDSVTADRMVRVAAAPSNSNPFHTYMPSLCDGGNGKNRMVQTAKPREKLTPAPPNSGTQGISIFFLDAFLYFNGFSQWFLIRNHPAIGGSYGWLPEGATTDTKDRPSSPASPSRIQHCPSQAWDSKGWGMKERYEMIHTWTNLNQLEPTWTNLNQQRLFRFPTPQNKINKSYEHGYLPRNFWLAVCQDHFRI